MRITGCELAQLAKVWCNLPLQRGQHTWYVGAAPGTILLSRLNHGLYEFPQRVVVQADFALFPGAVGIQVN